MLTVIYNTCGISGLETFDFYKPAIDSILAQQGVEFRLVLSDCCGSVATRNALMQEYGSRISLYNFIDEKLPVPVTFNHSVLKSIERTGISDGYLYVDSGIVFNNANDLARLAQLSSNPDYALVASRTDHDTGYYQWFGIGSSPYDLSRDDELFRGKDFVVPVGKAVNLHCQIFSHSLVEAYGRPYPDIFASHCSESTFSFLTAAIGKKWLISKDVVVHHRYLHGNASSVSPNAANRNRPHYDHPFKIPSVMDVMNAGHEFGMGFEECGNVLLHKPEKFDDNVSVDPQLRDFIKARLFLSKEQMDYGQIKGTAISIDGA